MIYGNPNKSKPTNVKNNKVSPLSSNSAVLKTANIIKNNDNGFLVDNMYQWEETLFKLINNNELRKKIGLKARETVNKSYSIESNSSKYLEVLKN